ncbi:MAG: cell division protein FtsA [Candidatus Campbellbacteria bacterium]|nr:cell division protein FtsA [Candidatus Campbellbacteria bacterium]
MSRIISTGLAIGTTTVRVVVSEYVKTDRGPLRRVLGTGFSESSGLRHGYIVDPEQVTRSVSRALSQAQRAAHVNIQNVLLSVGGTGLESFTTTGSTSITRADSEITDLDVTRAFTASQEMLPDIAQMNRKIIQTVPLSYKIDGKEALSRVVGMRGLKLEVKTLFITVLEQHLSDLIEAVESAGVEVREIIAAPIASAVATLTKAQRIAGVVLVDIGSETVSLIVYENDTPLSLKVFPRGGNDITNDIALGLRIPIEEAERVKTGTGMSVQYPRKKIDEIITARLKDIFDLVQTHLKKMGRDGLLPAGVVLAGGGAQIASIVEIAKSSLALPSRLGMIEVNSTAHGQVYDPSWTVAYGLSILGLSPDIATGAQISTLGQNLKMFKHTGSRLGELFKRFLP